MDQTDAENRAPDAGLGGYPWELWEYDPDYGGPGDGDSRPVAWFSTDGRAKDWLRSRSFTQVVEDGLEVFHARYYKEGAVGPWHTYYTIRRSISLPADPK